jgi:hypothetical protein
MFKILVITISLFGGGGGHTSMQTIGSFNNINTCETVARQMAGEHSYNGDLKENQYDDVRVLTKCYQDSDK